MSRECSIYTSQVCRGSLYPHAHFTSVTYIYQRRGCQNLFVICEVSDNLIVRRAEARCPAFFLCGQEMSDKRVRGGHSTNVIHKRMKHLIIIGARGAGRETFLTATKSFGYGHDFDVKGFLDGKTDALDGLNGYPPILSNVEDYEPTPDDVFVCALGDPKWRKHYASLILEKGGDFMTLIDKTARIGRNAKIGKGCIIRDYAMISCDVTIGDFTYIQPFVVIGHDASVGNFCHLNTYAFMGGYSSMADMAVIHTRGTLIPHKHLGEDAIIGAGSVAMTHVKNGTTVVGIPAKKLKV